MPSELPSVQEDEPLNELERQLALLMGGALSYEAFIQTFVESDLYILVDHEPEGNVFGNLHPMVVASSKDGPKLFAMFSNPVRAQRMMNQFSDYGHPILVNCEWVLEHLGPGMGVTFNPGCHNGFEMAPEGAQQLKAALAKARTATGE